MCVSDITLHSRMESDGHIWTDHSWDVNVCVSDITLHSRMERDGHGWTDHSQDACIQ